MKPPYILLLKGGRNSKDLYAIGDKNNRLTIPIFTDGIKCHKFIKKSNVQLTPTIVDNDNKLLLLLEAIAQLTITKWIVINPLKHRSASDGLGTCYHFDQMVAELTRNIKETKKRRNKNKNKNRSKRKHRKG